MINIALVGNPNCGKTTLFNNLTGGNLKVANWPGVTVERKEGYFKYKDKKINIIDLPGIYSLNSYSLEEKISSDYLKHNKVDLVLNVVDASNLEKSLYLSLQLIETGIKVIIVLNMYDIVQKRKMKIDMKKLSQLLNTKCIIISAKTKLGIDELKENILSTKETDYQKTFIKSENEEEIKLRYKEIDKIIQEVLIKKNNENQNNIDRILTSNYLGFIIFIIIMTGIFSLTFLVGDYIKSYFEKGLEYVSINVNFVLTKFKIGQAMKSLILDGIIGGVGGIITFLPNIFILFICLGILEDCGYMARIAFIMNEIMKKIGLNGKSCIPVVLGFGCSVPAVMATRMLKNKTAMKRTIRILPCISCSAKIPVYIMMAQIFMYKYKIIACVIMYFLGVGVAIVLLKTQKYESKENALIIELPDYRIPDAKTVILYSYDKVKEYLKKAGSIILIASLLLWAFLKIGKAGYTSNIEESFGAILGKKLEVFFMPIGLGYWQIIVSLISGIAAKEVIVSSMNIIFKIVNEGELGLVLSRLGFKTINAVLMMIFCLLYTPCVATLSAIYEETKSKFFTIKIACMQFFIAYVSCFICYNIYILINL